MRQERRAGSVWDGGGERSHAHGLLHPVDVLAVAVDAVVLVGGGAGVQGGDQGGRVPTGEERVLRVGGSGDPTRRFAPLLSFAFLFLSSFWMEVSIQDDGEDYKRPVSEAGKKREKRDSCVCP